MVEISHYFPEIVYEDNMLAKLAVLDASGNSVAKAMVVIYFNKLAVIESLSVLASYRRNGIGTKIVRKVESWAESNNAKYSFMRFAPCDFNDTFTLSKLLLANNYSFNGIGFIKKLKG